jgi:hypothetical protein
MKAIPFGLALQTLKVGALLALGLTPAALSAQDGHGAAHGGGSSAAPTRATNAFVEQVRDATRRFQDPNVALNEGYVPTFGCVTGSSEGVMGVHFVNFGKVGDPTLDIAQPELLVYEPQPNNRFRLVAADYLVLADAWDAANPGPPQLAGQLFHYFESPNRFGLPAFYTLHVWAWRDNPQGTFANWNPNVSCDAYNPQN